MSDKIKMSISDNVHQILNLADEQARKIAEKLMRGR